MVQTGSLIRGKLREEAFQNSRSIKGIFALDQSEIEDVLEETF